MSSTMQPLKQPSVQLVFDNEHCRPIVPSAMGKPADKQNKGYPYERLAEIAGRVCYDSFGKGRSSQDFHNHILEVNHTSVYEHCTMTFTGPFGKLWGVGPFLNRPGVFVRELRPGLYDVTLNPRVVIDWESHGGLLGQSKCSVRQLKDTLRWLVAQQMPMVMGHPDFPKGVTDDPEDFSIAAVVTEDQRWVSFWIECSRGCSHELVRHGDYTAISQRSTRYVDESESDWIHHPLVIEFCGEKGEDPDDFAGYGDDDFSESAQSFAQTVYGLVFHQLEPWLLAKGVDAATARKQARGGGSGLPGQCVIHPVDLLRECHPMAQDRVPAIVPLRRRGNTHRFGRDQGTTQGDRGDLLMTEYIVTIDPGTRETGWCLGSVGGGKGTILESGVVRSSSKLEWVDRVTFISRDLYRILNHQPYDKLQLIIELPSTYTGTDKGEAATNSGAIMKLMAIVWAVGSAAVYRPNDFLPTIYVPVMKWKGTRPKEITQLRISKYWGHCPHNHNEADAVGIFDWYVRKVKQFRPVPR